MGWRRIWFWGMRIAVGMIRDGVGSALLGVYPHPNPPPKGEGIFLLVGGGDFGVLAFFVVGG